MQVKLKLTYTALWLLILLFKFCKNEDVKNEFQSNFGQLFPNLFLQTIKATTTMYNLLEPKRNFGVENPNGLAYTSNELINGKIQQKFKAPIIYADDSKEPSSAIRLRLNDPFFQDTARLFYGVFSYEVRNIHIMPQQQCFQEGCFSLHSFKITKFQRPRGISVKPLPPNLLQLKIINFDVDILGFLNGNIQFLLTAVPVTGKFIVSARQLTITTNFDLQKTQKHIPFLRMQNCELQSGFVNTHVTDVSLFTDVINFKYKDKMIEKAKEMIRSTICDQIEYLIKSQINSRLNQMPRVISAAQILKLLTPPAFNDTHYLINKDNVHSRSNLNTNFIGRGRQRRQTNSGLSNWQNIADTFFAFDQKLLQNSFYKNDKGIATIREIKLKKETKNDPQLFEVPSRTSFNVLYDQNKNSGEKSTLVESFESKKGAVQSNKLSQENLKHSSLANKKSSSELKEKLIEEKRILFKKVFHENLTKKKFGPATIIVAPSKHLNEPKENKSSDSLALFLEFLDLNAIGRAFIDLDFLDSSASLESFSVGINGDIFLKPVHHFSGQELSNTNNQSEPLDSIIKDSVINQKASILNFVSTEPQKTLEVVFSEMTPNLLLYHAHRERLLRAQIDSKSPVFGKLLKTTCTLDEICFSDSVPELEEKYPNQSLKIQMETIRPPRLSFKKDIVRIDLTGEASFYLENTHQFIGRIPFETIAELMVRMSSKIVDRLEVSLVLSKLEILDDLNFFELPAETLSGLRNGVKGALENEAKRIFSKGVDIRYLTTQFQRYGLNNFTVNLMDNGFFLLQANVDVYHFVFEPSNEGA